MESILLLVKEANKDIRESPDKFDTGEKIINHYNPFYERVKDKISFASFESMCMQDFNFNFKVGNSDDIKESVNTKIKTDRKRRSIDLGVKRLNKFNAEQKQYLKQLEDTQPLFSVRPSKDFDLYGLRYPIEHYNTIGGSIIFLPLEDIINYADVVTTLFVDFDERFWIVTQYNNLVENYEESMIANLSSGALGNLAYIAMFCKHKPSADIALIILNKYYDLLMAELLFKMNTVDDKHKLN